MNKLFLLMMMSTAPVWWLLPSSVTRLRPLDHHRHLQDLKATSVGNSSTMIFKLNF